MLYVRRSYKDSSIQGGPLDGIPSLCLIENTEDGLLWVVSDSPMLPKAMWEDSHAAGASGIIVPMPNGSMAFCTAADFEANSSTVNYLSLAVDSRYFVMITSVPTHQDLLPRVIERSCPFCNLHAHSEYSPLDGLATIQEMADAAAADGQPALAVTDHGYCAGHPEHQKVCAAVGIKPIFGIEANFVNNRLDRGGKEVLKAYWHLILLAKTERGLRNLWASSTEAATTGFYGRARMDWSTIEKYAEGMICSTACLRGPLADLILADDYDGAVAMLSRLRSIFKDDLVLELHTNQLEEQIRLNKALVQLGHEQGIPLIVVADSHYACRDDKHAHKTWLAVQLNKDADDTEGDLFQGEQDYHVHSAAEVEQAIAYLGTDVVQAAMRMTVEIADRCDVTIQKRSTTPVFHRKGYDDGMAEDDRRLRELCEEGFAQKCAHLPNVEEYRERMEFELDSFISKRFSGYMLIEWELCDWTKSHGILMGPGRGSAAGSLVCWLLRITEVDPIRYNLPFGRFMTPGRTSLPDIDSDFPASKRPIITQHIEDRWGTDHVIRVGLQTRLKSKGVIKAVAKAMKNTVEVPFTVLDELSAIITLAEAGTAGLGLSWDELWFQYGDYQRDESKGTITLNQARQQYPQIFAMCDKFVGRLKSYGRHAAGIVINPMESIKDLPAREAKDGQLTAEFSMDDLEYLGYVKFDELTLRTLDTLQECIDRIKADPNLKGKSPDLYAFTEDGELADPAVWDMMCAGDTLGIFQIETSAGTRLVRQFQPRNLDDLCAIGSLVRPGPQRSGLTAEYLKRRSGEVPVSFPHPLLEQALGATYGTMIYQEDIMNVCRLLAGYDDDQADGVRKILGKKKVSETVEAGRKFVEAAVSRGIDRDVVEPLWEQMAEFAKYSFNRSHSMAYAMLAYWTAWCKYHYPAHFVSALLSTVDSDRIPEFVEMARRLGYKVLPPDINASTTGFSVSEDRLGVRYGFDSVSGVGEASSQAILQGQPYISFADFLERRGPACNLGHIKTLASLGTFNSLLPEGVHQAQLEAKILEIEAGISDRCVHLDGTVRVTTACTFDWSSEPAPLSPKTNRPMKLKPPPKACTRACRQYTPIDANSWPEAVAYTPSMIRWREHRVLGTFLTSTPFDRFADEMDAFYTGSMIEQGPPGRYFTAGLVTRVKIIRARDNRPMAFIGVQCFDTTLDITVFNSTWVKYQRDLGEFAFGAMDITKNDRGYNLVEFYPVPEHKE